MEPIIGITTTRRKEIFSFTVSVAYADAVISGKGLPILLPPQKSSPESLLERINGLIISGGGDIDPAQYDGSFHDTIYSIDPERDQFEIQAARFALENGLPVLGICRGAQILVVASGGTLVPHIPDVYGASVAHRLDLDSGAWHPTKHLVQIVADSRLAKFLQATELLVVSCHHQSIKTVPPGWRAVAHTLEDGVIEAVEHQHHPWAIGVQWHPEMLINNSAHQRIFQAFVEATKSIMSEKKSLNFTLTKSL